MNGYELYRQAAALLGYYDDGIRSENDGYTGETTVYINQILTDLGCRTISTPTDEILTDGKKGDALAAGVAMLTALAVGDMTKAGEFEEM